MDISYKAITSNDKEVVRVLYRLCFGSLFVFYWFIICMHYMLVSSVSFVMMICILMC